MLAATAEIKKLRAGDEPCLPIKDLDRNWSNWPTPANEVTLCLSIQQPWAWAIFSQPPLRPPAVRAKDCENRTWSTDYRGHLLIPAGRNYDEAGRRWIRKELGIHAPEEGDCRLGGIIGSVFLVACAREWRSPWYGGPWAFVFERPYPLPFFRCRGQLKFFEVPG